MKNLIEISTKKSKAGRTPAKFVLHKIYRDASEYNSNGISWNRDYTEQNKSSVIGMPLICQFADEDNEIPMGGHGDMTTQDGEIVFENSLVVGSFENAYIDDNIEINGEKISGLVGECYIYNQRFPELVKYLEEEYQNNNPVESSVEICADKSKGNQKIIYDGGWKEKGRVPKDYQYSGQALCIGVEPADNSALMIELNSKQKQEDNEMNNKKVKTTQTVEINELSYDDIATLVTRAFNTVMTEKNGYDCCYRYWIYKLYPNSSRVIMQYDYETPYKYYLTTYEILNNSIILGDISEVEQTWVPVENEQSVEVNTKLIQDILNKNNKEANKHMEDNKVILELNQKIEDKTTEINQLTTSHKELSDKNAELNEVIVNANKSLEEANAKVCSLTEELNACKAELDQLKAEKEEKESAMKKAEVNSYFTIEIPKNGFAEEEINSLQHYVDEVDLTGLKTAESELCAKKFKELKAKEIDKEKEEIEINSAMSNSFIAIHEKEKKVVSDSKDSFFN